jgi:hypothetical protein
MAKATRGWPLGAQREGGINAGVLMRGTPNRKTPATQANHDHPTGDTVKLAADRAALYQAATEIGTLSEQLYLMNANWLAQVS